MTLTMLLLLASTLAASIQHHYADREVGPLKALCTAATDRAATLLCRYRLYPLTRDARYVDDLPTGLEDGTAREFLLDPP